MSNPVISLDELIELVPELADAADFACYPVEDDEPAEPERDIPYPDGVRLERPDGLEFQCPCDPDSRKRDTYISFIADFRDGHETCTCGGCGRTYVYKAFITEYLEIDGDDWQVQL